MAGIEPIIDQYNGIILDLWGVVHDGQKPHDGVLDCLDELIKRKKTILILSNAPRTSDVVAQRMAQIGIGPEYYHSILSSGELTYQALRQNDKEDWRVFFHIGPERDESVYEGLRFTATHNIEEADFIINTGPEDFDMVVEDFMPILKKAQSQKLPMVCANPDITVKIGAKQAICAGAISQAYEKMGGQSFYYGKPFINTYEACFQFFEDQNVTGKILAIGDSLHTDITGGNQAKIDTAWVIQTGIHASSFPNDILDENIMTDLIKQYDAYPDYVIPRFNL